MNATTERDLQKHGLRRFLRAVLLFSIPLFVGTVALEMLLRRIPNDYSFKEERMEALGPQLEVLVLGSSHAYLGIDPAMLGAPAFNLANIHQGPMQDLALLQRHLPHLPDLRCIVLSVSYFTLDTDLRQSPEDWRAKNYVIHHHLPQFARNAFDHVELPHSPVIDHVGHAWRYLVSGADHRVCTDLGQGAGLGREHDDIDLRATLTLQRHTANDSILRRMNSAALDALASITEERGIHLHLITTPAWSSYRAGMDTEQWARVQAEVHRLVDRYPHVTYMDLLDHPTFLRDDMEDADHLNKQGAEKLSQLVRGQLIRCQVR